jgi:glycosyltransferase involved in cell wall biosynthesis
MKKVLIIAYHYPPRGGAGVHRSINLVNTIREFGYEPVVLTITAEEMVLQNERVDQSLLDKVPADVEVHRTASGIPHKFKQTLIKMRLFRLAWYFMYSMFWETAARWHKVAFPIAKKIIKDHDIKLVYTSSGPFASMVLADRLQKELGMKWVADLRDPFTDAYAWKFPSYYHWKRMRKFEEKYFSQPDKLIVNTPEVERLYLKRGLVTKDKVTVVTNGY